MFTICIYPQFLGVSAPKVVEFDHFKNTTSTLIFRVNTPQTEKPVEELLLHLPIFLRLSALRLGYTASTLIFQGIYTLRHHHRCIYPYFKGIDAL